METDSKGRVLCDHEDCGKVATVNYQTGTVRWNITRTGNYKFDELFGDEGMNEHWCTQHDTNE